MNFWGYIIQGVTDVINVLITRLPMGTSNTVVASSGAILYYMMGPLLLISSFLNLGVVASVIGVIGSLTIVKSVIALLRWIYKLIPAAG